MADISLRSYLEEIDRLIEGNQIDEAIAHTKYILGMYPKNLEAYRVLAKALLEKNRHMDAADIFQRVLSAVPDDFVSHIGMSIAREDESNIEAAIWHMERAFETQPSSAPVQEELKRLHSKRIGVEPPKIRLTRGALARLYEKGHHYQQAIAELHVALKEEPSRYDLKVLLAQALWHANRRTEAADVCNQILEILPFCREANRLLARIWIESGREADAKVFTKRLEALDPYETFADPHDNGQGASLVAADNVRLPRLEYVQSAPGSSGDASRPSWMQSVGVQFDQPQTTPDSESPDWLSGLNVSGIGEPAAAPSTMEAPASETSTAGNDDWINTFAQPTGAADEVVPTAQDELPDWLSGGAPAAAAPAPQTEAPQEDWLSTLGGVTEQPKASGANWMQEIEARKQRESSAAMTPAPATDDAMSWLDTPTETAQAAPRAAPAEDVPDWLKGATPSEPAPAASTDDMPDWLKGGAVETPTTTAAQPAEDVPDWLKGAAPSEPAPAASTDAMPDWLKGGAAEATTTAPATSADEMPDWLKGESAPATPTAPAETMPDWMQSAAAPTAAAAEDVPDWLKEPAPKAGDTVVDFLKEKPAAPETPHHAKATAPISAPTNEDDALAWLESLAAKQGANPDELVTGAKAQEADTMPDWLMGTTTAAAAPAPAAETPDWLKEAAPAPGDTIVEFLKEKPAAPETPHHAKATAPISPPANEDDALAWLEALAVKQGANPDELVTGAKAQDADAIPDWLKGTTTSEEPTLAAPAENIPDWLKEPTPQAGDTIAEFLNATPAAPAEEKPDWLKQMEAESDAYESTLPATAAASAPTAEAAAAADPEIPEWMAAMGWTVRDPSKPLEEPNVFADEPEPQVGDSQAKPAHLPDWLENMKPKEEEAPPAVGEAAPDWLRTALQGEAATPAPAAEAAPPLTTPDWLKEATPAPGDTIVQFLKEKPAVAAAPPASEDDALAWLESLAAKQGANPDELVSTAQARETVSTDWLREPKEEAPAVSIAEEAVPAWLRPPQDETPVKPSPKAAAPPEDDAMTWLESLTTKQGAKPDELVTGAKAAKTDIPVPAWLHQVTKPLSNFSEPPLEDLVPKETKPAEVVAIRKGRPADAEPLPEPKPEDDALAWLESLAAKQGANPDELVSGVTAQSEVSKPAWLQSAPEQSTPDTSSIESWLKQGREETEPEPPAIAPEAEVPAWLKEPAPKASDSIVEFLKEQAAPPAAEEKQEWLKQMEAEADQSEATLPPAMPAAIPAPASEDDALAWLESLAAKQGANPDELVSGVTAKTEIETPDWVKKSVETEKTKPIAEKKPPAEDKPSWLRQMEAESDYYEGTLSAEAKPAEIPGWLQNKQLEDTISAVETPKQSAADDLAWLKAPAKEEKPATPVVPAPKSEEDALAWLESLAARQGANPEELVSGTAHADTPEWVKQSALEEQPPKPDWQRLIEEAEQKDSHVDDDDIPAWLKAPAPADSNQGQGIADFLQAKPTTPVMPSPAPEPVAPPPPAVTTRPMPVTPPPSVAPQPVAVKPSEPPAPPPPAAVPQPVAPVPAPAKPKRTAKPKAKRSDAPPPETVLAAARTQLSEANIGEALDTYAKLIQSGAVLSEVMADLEGANHKYPNTPDLMRALGDAYMKDGQLQRSLDLYRQALQIL